MSSSSSSSKSTLSRILVDQLFDQIDIRNEVEQCMNDIIIDIEFSNNLYEQIQHHNECTVLQQQLKQYKHVIDETIILNKQQQLHKDTIATQLLMDVWNYSKTVGILLQTEKNHKELLINYDEILAQLLHTQDELEESKLSNNNNNNTNNTNNSTTNQQQQEQQQGEEELQEQHQQQSNTTTNEVTSTEVVTNPDDNIHTINNTSSTTTENNTNDNLNNPTTASPILVLSNETASTPPPAVATTTLQNVNDNTDVAKEPVVELIHDYPPVVVVELIHEDNDNINNNNDSNILNLDQLDTNILLHIFLYLDPLDVLNVAQINISMYSRVDSLFNPTTSSTATSTTDNNNNNDNNNSIDQVELAVKEEVVVETMSPSVDVVDPVSGGSTTKIGKPTLVSLPMDITSSTASAFSFITPTPSSPTLLSTTTTSATSKVATASSSTATTASVIDSSSVIDSTTNVSMKNPTVSTISMPPTNNNTTNAKISPPKAVVAGAISSSSTPRNVFSSVLQPKLRTASPPRNQITNATADAAAASSHRRRSSLSSQQQQPAPALNAAMASSMAAKLSDTELNAIIMMTERLKQKEYLASQYKIEKDTLIAKLDGTESVKQFLINKVRDMEQSLNVAYTNEMNTSKQYEHDQEVIHFLDEKVKELQNDVVTIQNEKNNISIELDTIKKQYNEKSIVMNDMLQFEREKIKNNDIDYKLTKKLLIKEVKNLRYQISTLQLERDSYKNDKETLTRALNSGSGSSGYHLP